MKRIFRNVFIGLFLISIFGCEHDPLLGSSKPGEGHYESKSILITNSSSHAVGVCDYYYCDINIPSGETATVGVRFFSYEKGEERDFVRITIRTLSDRIAAPLKDSDKSFFMTEGNEIRWLGNFSGHHSFTVTKELADAAVYYLQGDNDFREQREIKFAKMLNSLDPYLTVKGDLSQNIIEIALPESDTEIYWGMGATTQPDGVSAGGASISTGGWLYEQRQKEPSINLFNGFTSSTNFSCTYVACIPDL
jgi:hypothetical protein